LLLPAARAADAAPPSPDRPEAALPAPLPDRTGAAPCAPLADRPAAAPVAPLARPAWALAAGAPPCRRLRRSIIWSQAEPRLVGALAAGAPCIQRPTADWPKPGAPCALARCDSKLAPLAPTAGDEPADGGRTIWEETAPGRTIASLETGRPTRYWGLPYSRG